MFMTPPWRDAFRHAAQTADRLGLEDEHRRLARMERVRRSLGQTRAGHEEAGLERDPRGRRQALQCAPRGAARQPGSIPGPAAGRGDYSDEGAPAPDFYRDVAVIAFAIPPADATPLGAAVTSSAGPVDAAQLGDGHLAKGVVLPFPKDGTPAWLQWDLGSAQSVRAFTLAFAGTPQLDFLIDSSRLQAATAGQRRWRELSKHRAAE